MKKYELIIITLIFILSIICLSKKNYKKKETNSLTKIPIYKEKYHQRYLDFQKKMHLSDLKVILYVNIGLDKPFYNNIFESRYLNTNYLLVNKYNRLNKNYVPKDLVLSSEYSNKKIYLVKEAYESFKKMALHAKNSNLNIRIISGYRSYDYQDNLYKSYLKYDKQEDVDTYSARAGHSEHQTGLTIDVDNIKTNYNDFFTTKEFKWMQDNAYRYGFILRYPKGKEYITGYSYEPWHYRYVGTKISEYIHKHKITFEEYYYMFID